MQIKKEAETSLHRFYIQVIALRNHKSNERTMGGQVGSFGNTDYCAISVCIKLLLDNLNYVNLIQLLILENPVYSKTLSSFGGIHLSCYLWT